MNPSFKYTQTYKLLKGKYDEEHIAKIADALFLVYHPMSDFFELSIMDKKAKAAELILVDIDWKDIEEAESAYKQLVIPREKSMYIHMAHLLDWTFESCVKIKEQREGKFPLNITKDLLKEITVFASKYSILKEDLRKERAKAKQVVQQKTFGNLTLSSGDERFTRT